MIVIIIIIVIAIITIIVMRIIVIVIVVGLRIWCLGFWDAGGFNVLRVSGLDFRVWG